MRQYDMCFCNKLTKRRVFIEFVALEQKLKNQKYNSIIIVTKNRRKQYEFSKI